MVQEKLIPIRVSQTLLRFIDQRVISLSTHFRDKDQQFDRSKYIRELIRADMENEKNCNTSVIQTEPKQKTASKPAVWNFPK